MLNLDGKARTDYKRNNSILELSSLKDLEISDKNLKRFSYTRMVCQTVEGIEELEDYATQSKIKRELPRHFAKNIIELENIIDLHHSKIDEMTIEKLACLYKV